MYATIQKWGNSQGLRIPKSLLDALGIRENDRVELLQAEDGIHIKSALPFRTAPWRSALRLITAKPLIRSAVSRRSLRLTGVNRRALRYGERY